MQAYSVETGKFKLDGGAMFGVVPKVIWNKSNPADENNLCTWALRCLVILEGDRIILIDTGMGDKQDAKFFSHYQPHETVALANALEKINLTVESITDVLLTHLHFDHVGGAISKVKEDLVPTFPNATYWVSETQWSLALNPNKREKASFLTENILPLQKSGRLKLITLPPFESNKSLQEIKFTNAISCLVVNGHTQGMLLPKISIGKETIVYMADLLPSIGHIPLPYVMGYDMQPLVTLEEKEKFLTTALQEDYILFFEHDAVNECCRLVATEKGIRAGKSFTLKEIEGLH
jgi:glyoxylase-like metal-dependent hydrolase (beta-lactamase superfamily II)